jgi:hypothetical protein
MLFSLDTSNLSLKDLDLTPSTRCPVYGMNKNGTRERTPTGHFSGAQFDSTGPTWKVWGRIWVPC